MPQVADSDTFEPGARRVEASRVREANRRAVLTVIASEPGSSAADIARTTGLGPQTVSRNVTELETAGLVRRGPVRRGYRGQPATQLYVAENGAYSMGCEIGFRSCQVFLRALGGEVIDTRSFAYDTPLLPLVFRELETAALALTARLPRNRRGRIVGLGVALPSDLSELVRRLDPAGTAEIDTTIADLRLRLEHRLGVAVTCFNDGSAACWAELAAQPPPRPANFIYMMVGTFVSSGLIAEGRLWEGPSGSSANLGTMIVSRRDGEPAFVHDIASISGLERRLAADGRSAPAGPSDGWDWDTLGGERDRWLDEAGLVIAKALTNAAAVIEVRRAIVDAVLPRKGLAALIASIEAHTSRLPRLRDTELAVSAGSIGSGAAMRGAALLPLYRAHFSPDLVHFGA